MHFLCLDFALKKLFPAIDKIESTEYFIESTELFSYSLNKILYKTDSTNSTLIHIMQLEKLSKLKYLSAKFKQNG